MAKPIILINVEGEIQQTIHTADPMAYPIGEQVNGMECMFAPDEIKDDLHLASKTKWLDNGVWKTRTAKPGSYYRWIGGEWVLDKPALVAELKAMRIERLRAVDWTQLPDVTITPAEISAWRTYRQELRDLPSLYPNITHIDEVVWPTPPL